MANGEHHDDAGTMPMGRFLVWLIGAWLGVLLVAATVNYVVDPYGLFDTPRIDGVNRIKPEAGDRSRTAKAYQVLRRAPTSLIVGNSRPEMGIDPQSACWPVADRPVFNLALPGANVFRQARYAQHAVVGIARGGGQVRRIIWGLDFTDFIELRDGDVHARTHWADRHFEFDDRLLIRADGRDNERVWLGQAEDFARGLFSLETLSDALFTIASQGKRHAATLRADGYNPAEDFLDIIHTEGQAALFRHKLAYLRTFVGHPARTVFTGETAWSEHFQALQEMLEQLRATGVEVILFINPYHADYLRVINEVGKWDQFEAWKRTLARVAEQAGVPLWDFNAFNDESRIPSPPPGDTRSVLRWFWEPAHYRREYGERILATLLPDTPCVSGEPGLGVRIDGDALEPHLADLRAGLIADLDPPRQ